MTRSTRRDFFKHSISCVAAASAAGPLCSRLSSAAEKPGSKMKLGLVTYLWGQDWDLPTLITNCDKTGVLGVELRTTHRHGVEPGLDAAQRKQVKQRFDDSPAVFVGPGSNERFDDPDPARLTAAIEATKAFVRLSHDCGGSGVKVKPNSFHEDVPREKTIEQIGKALNTVGEFAGDYGQEIRLEVHGSCCELPTIKAIMAVADNPNVGVCWNSNGQDLAGEGLVHNFNLVKDRFSATVHVREFNVGSYPYAELLKLLVGIDYAGWILLECRTRPKDRVAALIEQRELFEQMLARS